MAKPRLGLPVVMVDGGQEFAAVVTYVREDSSIINLTYFPDGGGAHGAPCVPHVSNAKDGERCWRRA